MLLLIARRVGIFAASLILGSVVVFGFMAILPGDPARIALGMGASEESVAQLRDQFGLNQPLVTRYLDWLHGIVTLDLGYSYITRAPIGPEIERRIPITLILACTSMAIAVMIAIPVGTIMAVRHRRRSGLVLSVASQVGIAVPAFLAGILLVTIFSVQLGWLPANGWTPPETDFGMFLRQLILPVLALALVQAAILSRYVRSSILDVLQQDYIRTARAKGLQPAQALLHHGLRNAAIPVVTVIAVQFVYLLLGAVVVERVFVIPGLGSMLLDSVANRDLLTVQDVVMLIVVAALAINLVVDILYGVLDPRVRAVA
jgi:peptide/nickel transport system permease protein